MMAKRTWIGATALVLMTVPAVLCAATPVDESFTYQGRLKYGGLPANDDFDFAFQLYDASSGGTQVGSTIYKYTVAVEQGLFTEVLNFGDVFQGDALWLQVYVRTAGGGSYTPLYPRQGLAATPYASGLKMPFAGITTSAVAAFKVTNSDTGSHSHAIHGVRGTETGNGYSSTPIVYGESASTGIGVLGISPNWGVGGACETDYGTALQGEVFYGTEHATAIRALNSESYLSAELATDTHAGYFNGDVHVEGELTKEYSYGTADPAAPLAYGFINSDGTVQTATPNVSCTWSAAGSRYEITIAGENYFYDEYVTVVTPSGDFASPRTGSVSDNLLVYFENEYGGLVQRSFQFITYKPTGAKRLGGDRPRAVPTPENPGITDEELCEQLGLFPAPQRELPDPAAVEAERKAHLERSSMAGPRQNER